MGLYDRVPDWPMRMRHKVGEMRDGEQLYAPGRLAGDGVMVISDPNSEPPFNKPWWRTPFDGCFGDRKDPALSSWIVVYPKWML